MHTCGETEVFNMDSHSFINSQTGHFFKHPVYFKLFLILIASVNWTVFSFFMHNICCFFLLDPWLCQRVLSILLCPFVSTILFSVAQYFFLLFRSNQALTKLENLCSPFFEENSYYAQNRVNVAFLGPKSIILNLIYTLIFF